MQQFVDLFQRNAESIGSAGIILFAFIGLYPLLKQGRTILSNKSGESVSRIGMSYLLGVSIVTLTYGMTLGKVALIINGLGRGIPFLIIVIGLLYVREFSKKEKWIGAALVLIASTMWFVPHKREFYFWYSSGTVVALLVQLHELVKKKTRGDLNVDVLWIYIAASAFWISFGFAIHDWGIWLISILICIILLITVALWYSYPKSKEKKT